MKKIFLFLFILVGVLQFVPVDIVMAQEPGLWQLSQCSGTDCSACNVVHLANGVIKWLIGILFVLFAFLVAIAGVRLVVSGGNHHALDEAKDMFMNAIIGFIIILAAWLIVDTVMRALVGGGGNSANDGSLSITTGGKVTGWMFWSDVQCQVIDTPGYDPNKITLDYSEPIEAAIDQGGGTSGSVIIQTPAGPQAVDVRACDTSSLTTVNFLGGRVTVNKQFAASVQRIDAAWRAKGGQSFYRVTSIGGYNCRNIAGTNRKSNHAYGVAIDINPAQNPHTKPGSSNYGQTNMPPAFRQLFLNEGWGWGGNWKSSKDTMHFSKATGEGGNMRGN